MNPAQITTHDSAEQRDKNRKPGWIFIHTLESSQYSLLAKSSQRK